MKDTLHTVLSVRLFTSQKCFGPGIAELLHCVEEYHSLRKAAQSMGMAYSKAWTIVKRSEEALGFPLLISATGGKNGGGAVLTDEASRLLGAYDEYCEKLRSFADRLLPEEFGFLL